MRPDSSISRRLQMLTGTLTNKNQDSSRANSKHIARKVKDSSEPLAPNNKTQQRMTDTQIVHDFCQTQTVGFGTLNDGR